MIILENNSLDTLLSKINEKRIIEIAKNLIGIPSVTGEEKDVMNYVRDLFEGLGISVELYGTSERPIINAILNPGSEKLLAYNGHLDVVPIARPEAWTKNPWDPIVEDDLLYGRGASDMKASCAVMIHVLEILKDLDLNLAICAHLVPDEEKGGQAGTKILVDMIQKGSLRRPDYVIIGEKSNLKIRVAERGMFGFKVKFFGRAAHTAAARTTGINAIAKASKGILSLEHHIDKFHEWIGYPMLSVNMIEAGKVSNQVPAECTITVDRRLIIGETADEVFLEVKKDLDRAGKGDSDYRYEIIANRDEKGALIYTPANFTSPNSELGQAFMKAVSIGLKKEPELYVEWAGSTDGRLYRQAGIPTIGFGPKGEGAHGPDESVPVDSLVDLAKVYLTLAHELSQK
jgi:acetylornithine deacetylase/succinyl-diaminopimelate desuccinylase family protein